MENGILYSIGVGFKYNIVFMNNTKELARKKIIGTAIFALFVFGLALSASSSVQALFVNTKGNFNVDGTVTNVGSSSLTISTNGSSNITFNTEGANIIPKGTVLDSLVNKRVRVNAKPDGENYPIAIVIKKLNSNDPGYGTQGDNVNIHNAVVSDINVDVSGDSGTFTVNIGNDAEIISVTFTVLPSTKFSGDIKDFSDLETGFIVKVNGEDNIAGFTARTVIVKKK